MVYRFYDDPEFNYRVQVALGGVPAGLGDVGEILTVVSAVRSGDDAGWASAFHELAQRVERLADSSRSQDRRSAADAYLRAATYYAAQLEAVQAGADDGPVRKAFEDHRRCWDAFVDLTDPPLERVAIPYSQDGRSTAMPGFFLSHGERRPTFVFINGSDGALTWVWQELLAAYERGCNGLVFDGPGQQSMLFEQGVPFRPDWEAVITPIVDLLLARDDVDPQGLVLWGGSQGGFWGARALAFEHRFAAAFLDPGVVDVSTSWLSHFPPQLVDLLKSGDKKDFDAAMEQAITSPQLAPVWNFRARPYGVSSPYDVCRAMMDYTVEDVAHAITTPVMIADPEGEQFWPGQSARLAELIGDRARLEHYTVAEGADMHCEPMARSLVHQRMFDWLTAFVPLSGSVRSGKNAHSGATTTKGDS